MDIDDDIPPSPVEGERRRCLRLVDYHLDVFVRPESLRRAIATLKAEIAKGTAFIFDDE